MSADLNDGPKMTPAEEWISKNKREDIKRTQLRAVEYFNTAIEQGIGEGVVPTITIGSDGKLSLEYAE